MSFFKAMFFNKGFMLRPSCSGDDDWVFEFPSPFYEVCDKEKNDALHVPSPNRDCFEMLGI